MAVDAEEDDLNLKLKLAYKSVLPLYASFVLEELLIVFKKLSVGTRGNGRAFFEERIEIVFVCKSER